MRLLLYAVGNATHLGPPPDVSYSVENWQQGPFQLLSAVK